MKVNETKQKQDKINETESQSFEIDKIEKSAQIEQEKEKVMTRMRWRHS